MGKIYPISGSEMGLSWGWIMAPHLWNENWRAQAPGWIHNGHILILISIVHISLYIHISNHRCFKGGWWSFPRSFPYPIYPTNTIIYPHTSCSLSSYPHMISRYLKTFAAQVPRVEAGGVGFLSVHNTMTEHRFFLGTSGFKCSVCQLTMALADIFVYNLPSRFCGSNFPICSALSQTFFSRRATPQLLIIFPRARGRCSGSCNSEAGADTLSWNIFLRVWKWSIPLPKNRETEYDFRRLPRSNTIRHITPHTSHKKHTSRLPVLHLLILDSHILHLHTSHHLAYPIPCTR